MGASITKSEFKAFRSLLKGAIGNRSQVQFAKEAGLSSEHINRMLNREKINRPARTTLLKIAAIAKNGITYRMLENALDQEDPIIEMEQKIDSMRIENLLRTKKECRLTFSQQAEETLSCLSQLLTNGYCEKQTRPSSIPAFMDKLLTQLRKEYPDVIDIIYDIRKTRNYYGSCIKAQQYTTIELMMSDEIITVYSKLILYHDKAPANRILIQNARMDLEAIYDLYGCPPCLSDRLNRNNTKAEFTELMKLPFYTYIQTNHGSGVLENAEYFLDWTIGEKPEYQTVIEGFGFWLPEIPDNFPCFIRSHLDTILNTLKLAYDFESDLINDLDTIKASLKSELGAKIPDKQHIANILSLSENINWLFIIASTMETETRLPIFYYTNTNKTGAFLSKDPCIMLRNDDLKTMGMSQESVLNLIYSFAQELGLKTFGDILFYTTVRAARKPYTYQIREDAEMEHIFVPDFSQMDIKTFKPNQCQPKKTGIYRVWLKDGRDLLLRWQENGHCWIGRYKDWTSQVVKWCIKD